MNLRLTHRTARVLEGIAELSGRGSDPSNRQVATFAGVTDPGQISKLLRRLERLGLLRNTGAGHAKGEPNAWALTDKGERVTHSIRDAQRPSRAAGRVMPRARPSTSRGLPLARRTRRTGPAGRSNDFTTQTKETR